MSQVGDGQIDLFYELVGKNIKAARVDAEMSQTMLAQQIGFKRSSVANLEAGRQRIALHLFFLIAEALSISPAALLPDVRLLKNDDPVALEKLSRHLIGTPETTQDFVRETIAKAAAESRGRN